MIFEGKSYEQMLGQRHQYFIKRKCRILRSLISKYKGPVLELAAGTGEAQKFLAEDAVCEDVSLSMLQQAQTKGITKLINADATKLSFKDSSFGVVYSFSLFHHLSAEQRRLTLAEAKRVLRPGGILVTFEHNPLNILTQVIVKACPIDREARLVTHTKLAQLKQKQGFKVQEIKFFLLSPVESSFIEKIERHLMKWPLGGQYYVLAKNIK